MHGIRQNAGRLIFLCIGAYFCSYLTRLNYAAVMVEMIAAEGFTKTAASAALTGLFITYGFGQLVSGYLGDRMKPELLIFSGLLLSAVMNLLIPICSSALTMTVVWCINGFAQAMMWPPMVRIMAELLTENEYRKATVWVSWGSAGGTIWIYLTAPLCIALGGWRLVFFVSAAAAIFMSFFWLRKSKGVMAELQANKAIRPTEAPASEGQKAGGMKLPVLLLIPIMLAIVCQGLLRDGVTTWTPTYLSENFQLGSAISILSSVVLPLFSVFSFQLTSILNRRLIRNEMACAGTIFAIGAAAILGLRFFGTSFGFSVAALALAVGCMHGINLILICMVPAYFKNTGKTAFISGLLNACTYIGSAFSMYGVAALIEGFGWAATEMVWLGVALAGMLCCFLALKSWHSFREKVLADEA